MNMLLVDQNRDRALRLTLQASELGHLISVAYDLDTALDWAGNTRFDLIVLNTRFPPPHTVQGLAQIRRNSLSQQARVVAVSDDRSAAELNGVLQNSIDTGEFELFLAQQAREI